MRKKKLLFILNFLSILMKVSLTLLLIVLINTSKEYSKIIYILFFVSFIIFNLKKFIECSFLNEKVEKKDFIVFIVSVFLFVLYENNNKYMEIIVEGIKKNMTIIGLLIILIIWGINWIIKYKIKEDEKIKIFPKREKDLKELTDFFVKKTKKTLLVVGEWGSGKTHLVKYFFQENKEYFPIWIKSSIYDSKVEIRDFIIKELDNLIEEHEIGISSFNKLLNSLTCFSKINIFSEYGRKFKRKLLTFVEKEIVLIIDDLDRMQDEKQIKEFVSLIAEFEEYFNLRIIYLVDSKTMFEVNNNERYFNKYFYEVIMLTEISSDDIIKEELKENQYEDFKKILNNIITDLSARKYTEIDIKWKNTNKEKIENTEKIKNAVKRREQIIENFLNKLNNTRFMIRFVLGLKERKIFEYFEEYFKDKKLIVGSFLYFFLLKEEHKKELSLLKLEEEYDYYKNGLEEEYDIREITNFFEKIGIVSRYFLRIFKLKGEFTTAEKVFKEEIERIRSKYEKSLKENSLNEYSYQSLCDDMYTIRDAKLDDEKIKKFYIAFGEKISELYEIGIIKIEEVFEIVYEKQLIYFINSPLIEVREEYSLSEKFDEEIYNKIFTKIDNQLLGVLGYLQLYLLHEEIPPYLLFEGKEVFEFSYDYLKRHNIKISESEFPLYKIIKIMQQNAEAMKWLSRETKNSLEEKLENIKKHSELIESVFNYINIEYKDEIKKMRRSSEKSILDSEYLFSKIMESTLSEKEIEDIKNNWDIVEKKLHNSIEILTVKMRIEKLEHDK